MPWGCLQCWLSVNGPICKCGFDLEGPDLGSVRRETSQPQRTEMLDVPQGFLEGQGSAAAKDFVEHCISAAATTAAAAAAAAKATAEGRALEYECGDAAYAAAQSPRSCEIFNSRKGLNS